MVLAGLQLHALAKILGCHCWGPKSGDVSSGLLQPQRQDFNAQQLTQAFPPSHRNRIHNTVELADPFTSSFLGSDHRQNPAGSVILVFASP